VIVAPIPSRRRIKMAMYHPVEYRRGDYLEFDVCLTCGMIQNEFPVSDEALVKAGLLENADA